MHGGAAHGELIAVADGEIMAGLQESAICAMLDACLATAEELEAGLRGELPDPFAEGDSDSDSGEGDAEEEEGADRS
jgi:hypothetical protein